MNRYGTERITGAIAALVLAAASWAFGLHLLPSRISAIERDMLVQWLLSWIMIWGITVSAVALAGFLLFSSGKRNSE